MTNPEMQKFLAGQALDEDAESKALDALAAQDGATLSPLCRLLVNQRRRLQRELERARGEAREARGLLETLLAPPLFPGVVRRIHGDGRVDVIAGGRRRIVTAHPDVAAALAPGLEVLLGQEGGAVVSVGDRVRHGLVGTVSELDEGRLAIRSAGDEELVVDCAPELLARLSLGDRVTFSRELGFAFDRLPERRQSACALAVPPAIRFDDIGGLDPVIAEIRGDLDLHLLHPGLVARYRMQLLRGITLVGAPGVGKTMLAAAIARHLADVAPETRFLEVKPGWLRGQYYGQSEARIRELFAVARTAPGLVVMFFDELDTFGRRGDGVGQEIDGRVLGALLAEIDGLSSARNVLCIGATNRLDLIDSALVRDERFGDRVYQIPRPGREGTRGILARRLLADLPYAGSEAAEELVEAATSYLHAPAGGAGPVARLVLLDSSEREIRAPDVISGALLAGAVERAKKAAARRELEGPSGLSLDDLLDALDEGLASEAAKLSAPHVARQALAMPEIARVEIAPERSRRARRSLRAA